MRTFFRSVWDEPRPPAAPVRVWRDWVLVAVLVPTAVLEGVLRPGLPLRALSVVVTVGLVATLLWRRTRPLLMVVVAFVVLGLLMVLTAAAIPQMYTGAYVLLLPYALLRWGSGREAVIGSAVLFLKTGLSALVVVTRPSNVVLGAAVLVSAMALGAAFRFRAGARVRQLDQVRLLERERLARELHDTVAHHVSAIAIRAQAGLATSASRPDAAVEALRVIEAEASRTLTQMRSVVRVLRRSEPADVAPSPCIADLKRLAGRDGTGPPVDVEVSGDLADVPPSVGAAIYRLVQESVTNARRHARHATRIEVRVAADGSSVRLRVSDDGDTGLLRPAGSPGYGLIGMIERAHLLGGTCEAGPEPGRGWTVTAVLPRAGTA
ncbi:MAG TPA: sensor histidine kinase [Streptosporangiaceae bacterium]